MRFGVFSPPSFVSFFPSRFVSPSIRHSRRSNLDATDMSSNNSSLNGGGATSAPPTPVSYAVAEPVEFSADLQRARGSIAGVEKLLPDRFLIQLRMALGSLTFEQAVVAAGTMLGRAAEERKSARPGSRNRQGRK